MTFLSSVAYFVFPQRGYSGCLLLKPLADRLSLPVDYLNFFLAQIAALIIAPIYRAYIPPLLSSTENVTNEARARRIAQRHLFAITVGMILLFFCYGLNSLHILWQTIITYLMLRIVPGQPWIIFIICLGYLSIVHLSRLRNNYLIYTIDATGPMMISTQKLSALAFSLYDGRRKKKDDALHLTADQQEQMIDSEPTILELFSFIFNFHGILVGPLSFYNDYIRFVSGNDSLLDFEPSTMGNVKTPVIVKGLQSLLFLSLYLFLSPIYPIEFLVLPNKSLSHLLYKFYYLLPSLFLIRCKYYFAWKLAEAVNNAAGFGFNGFDEQTGAQRWNLLKNVSFKGVEFKNTYKEKLANWNIMTAIWLRRVCFDRVNTGRTFLVYMVSAFWHGFYPGYYLAFFSAALLSYTSRGFYRRIRPLSRSPTVPVYTKYIYDTLTLFLSILCANYCAVPFNLLNFERGFTFLRQTYFIVPIICAISCIVLPVSSSKKQV
ncbi:hypothetical protein GJ496_000765 [Pomphorhynchus laevis]|nr:hypothetical protein GJ496_000765 [Pomphorhynchus laevis]